MSNKQELLNEFFETFESFGDDLERAKECLVGIAMKGINPMMKEELTERDLKTMLDVAKLYTPQAVI